MSVVQNLKFQRSSFLLNVPHLELLDEGIQLLKGANGSGKSTFIYLLTGLLNAEQGFSWKFKNEDLARLSVEKRLLSVSFQKPQVFLYMSVKENILFPQSTQVWKNKKSPWSFDELIAVFNIEPLLSKLAFELSGGELQKLALVRALSLFPRLFIFDEPFSFLDIKTQERFRDFLNKRVKKEAVPILIISHDLKLLTEDFADKTFFMNSGQIS